MYFDIQLHPDNTIVSREFPPSAIFNGASSLNHVELGSSAFILNLTLLEDFNNFCNIFGRQYTLFNNVIVTGDFSKVEILTTYGFLEATTIFESNQLYFNIPTEIDFYCAFKECQESSCILPENGTIQDIELVIRNNSIVVRDSTTHLKNSTIIVIDPSEIPIVVNNGIIRIDNGNTLRYVIDDEEVLKSIRDGQRMIIISTSNGGEIEGSFDEFEFIPAQGDSCRKVEADLESTNTEISIVFKVSNQCGLPTWAIAVIVVGAVTVITAIITTVILIKKRIILKKYKSKTRAQNSNKK